MEREKMSLKSQSWNWQFSGRVQHERQRKWGSYKLVLPLLTNKCKWNWKEICLKLRRNKFEIGKKYVQIYDEPPPRPFHTFKFPHIAVEVETTPQVSHHHHHHLVIISVKLLYKFNFSWLIFFLFSLLHWRMRILKTSFASSSKPWWRRAKLAGCRFQEIIIYD